MLTRKRMPRTRCEHDWRQGLCGCHKFQPLSSWASPNGWTDRHALQSLSLGAFSALRKTLLRQKQVWTDLHDDVKLNFVNFHFFLSRNFCMSVSVKEFFVAWRREYSTGVMIIVDGIN